LYRADRRQKKSSAEKESRREMQGVSAMKLKRGRTFEASEWL